MKNLPKTVIIVGTLTVLIFILVGIVCINGRIQNRQLFAAIENNDYTAAKEAVDRGAWINLRKYLIAIGEIHGNNPTPLIAACREGNKEIITLLLENGANLEKPDGLIDDTPLLAVLGTQNENRFSLAMYLIEQGADIYVTTKFASPFTETLYIKHANKQTAQESFVLFKYLLQHNVDIEVREPGRENALTFTAHYGNYNAVEYLIEEGYFDVNDLDENGDTALIVATKYGEVEIVELLIKLGADKTIKSTDEKTALDYAIEINNDDLVLLLTK